jgi:membrane-associated protease RseP (regulator of RpoE activity)
VKIVGMNPYEEVPPEDRSRAYSSKPRWQRALVLLAGSATHWPVAFLVLVIAFMTIGFPTGELTNEVAIVETTVGGQDTPAMEAGLLPGDKIVGVGGEETSSWLEIREYIRDHAGESARFEILRDGQTETVTTTLGAAIFDRRGAPVDYAPPGEELRSLKEGETSAGFLGVQPEEQYETQSLGAAVSTGGRYTWEITKGSVRGIGQTFGQVFGGELWDQLTGQTDRGADSAFGLVGAGRLANDSVSRGQYLDLVGLVAAFAIFVGMMNLLPLPPLDGGHLAVVAYESVTRRDVDVRKLIPIAAAVISFFVLLFLAVLYLDVARPIDSPF